MQDKNTHLYWHVLALFVVIVWGATLASTKYLLQTMLPMQILLYRCVFALGILLMMSPARLRWQGNRNEALYFIAGLCGITLYFLFENTALVYTYSSNAALLVTASPLFTVLIAGVIIKSHPFTLTLAFACLLALFGVGLVLANQPMDLSNGMLGNLLAMLAGLVWAFFGFAMQAIKDDLNPTVRMQKVFLYGMLTTALYMIATGQPLLNTSIITPFNLANLMFLGAIASALCFVLWTRANTYLGVVTTSLYIYFIPLVAVILGVLLLGEKLTILTIIGGVLIALAVFLANYNKAVN